MRDPEIQYKHLVLPTTCFPIPSEIIYEIHTDDDYRYLLMYLLITVINASLENTGDHLEFLMGILGEILENEYDAVQENELSYRAFSQKEHAVFDDYMICFEHFQQRVMPFITGAVGFPGEIEIEINRVEKHPVDPSAIVVCLMI